MKLTVTTAALVCVLACSSITYGPPVKAGQVAPDFAGRTIHGKSIRLSSLRGKVVVLDFWTTTWAPCRLEMPVLASWGRKYRDAGLRVVGVTEMNPTVAEVKRALHERSIGYP